MAASTSEARGWIPNWATHPGEHLREHIEARGWSQAQFARIAGLTPKLVSTIIGQTNPVTPETAIKLERVLGVKAYIWTNLQARWDLSQAEAAEHAAAMDAEEWLRKYPIRELQDRGELPKSNDVPECLNALLALLQIGLPSAFEEKVRQLAVHHRQAKNKNVSAEHVYTWLMLGEKKARSVELPKYSKEVFLEAVKAIRQLTTLEPERFEPEMVSRCREAGVALIIEPPISKTCLFGSARWFDADKALIQMSLRMKYNDHFWWTFFHEAAHIILHRGKNFADDDKGLGDGEEEEADAFAHEILVGKVLFSRFAESKPRTKREVCSFANKINLHPGIVVGMLQYHKIIPFSHMNDLKEKFDWNDE